MKLVILDRDGVINRDSATFIKNPNEWIPIPGSLEAIALLNQHGYRVAVATNQSGIARGYFDMATLNAIHDKMHKALAQVGGRIDAVFYCPHAADAHCACRKPNTGMLEEISRRFNIELTKVPGSVMPCVTCRRLPKPVASRIWCARVRVKKPTTCLMFPKIPLSLPIWLPQ